MKTFVFLIGLLSFIKGINLIVSNEVVGYKNSGLCLLGTAVLLFLGSFILKITDKKE